MKRNVIWFLIGMIISATAYAGCVTQTYIGPNGQVQTCMTCCWGNQCTTTCM